MILRYLGPAASFGKVGNAGLSCARGGTIEVDDADGTALVADFPGSFEVVFDDAGGSIHDRMEPPRSKGRKRKADAE